MLYDHIATARLISPNSNNCTWNHSICLFSHTGLQVYAIVVLLSFCERIYPNSKFR